MAGPSDTPSGSATKRPKYQQLPKGGSGTTIQRHVNYTATAGEALSNGQKNSNVINDKGSLRKVACAPCLAAVQSFNKEFRVGRGQAKFNEFFACIVYNGYGVGGTQCGRCVGLGSGPKCVDPPAQVQKEVTALIKALPAYNKALKKTNSNDFESLTDADQRDILNAVELSSTFDLAWKGALKSGVAQTPAKKRTYDAFSTPTNELNSIQQSANDARADISSVATQIRGVKNHVKDLHDEVAELRSLLRNSRERERWMVDAMQGLINHTNRQYQIANPILVRDGTPVDPPAPIAVDDFDLSQCQFEDETGEAAESDVEDD